MISRLKLFMALSRTPHGLLDMATPGLAAVLWLGGLPPLETTSLGLLTAFAGYTAVYALNDLVDCRVDREKIQEVGVGDSTRDLDAVYIRHPLAQGSLSLWEGVLWAVGWSLIALVGAYVLNPVCAFVFLAGCLLEAIYCLLLRVSYLRTLVSGVVKSSGGIAAVFAVDTAPNPLFLCLLFLWLLLWEIGGQNVPNDWADLDEDKHLQAKTVPVRFGAKGASVIILVSLALAIMVSLSLFWATQAHLKPFYLIGTALVGFYALLMPAYRLHKTKTASQAFELFNRASYYPLAMLGIVVISWVM